MEPITRQAAKAAGQKTYFTGKPCRNNHLTYRYVQSGTCAGCVSDSVNGSRQDDRQTSAAKREALANLAEIKVRAYIEDAAMIRDTAAALCAARFPMLLAADVVSKRGPIDAAGGTALYRILVPAPDIDLVRETANGLLNARAVDVSAARARIVARACDMADKAASAAPPDEVGK